MRITAELRKKIDRSFSDMKSNRLEEFDRKLRVAKANLKNEFADVIKRTLEDADGTDYFLKAMVSAMGLNYIYTNDNAVEIIVGKMAASAENEEIKEIRAACSEISRAIDKNKEEFLIALSYAGGDMTSIKKVFEEYGLKF